jgi:hypothetical protein
MNSATSKKNNTDWKTLYRIGAYAALIAVIFFRRYLSAELMAFNGFGIFDIPKTAPVTATGWFNLFQKSKFVGLALLDIFDLVNYALVGLIFLALYAALRKSNEIVMGLATLSSIVGITVYFASNQALSFLHLSEQYSAATYEAQRSLYLAAGEALLANTHGTGMYISLFLVLLAGLIVSIVMLRSGVFNKATAVTGMLANIFGLAYFVVLIFAPAISWLPPTLSAPFRLIWYILISLRLFKLSKKSTLL